MANSYVSVPKSDRKEVLKQDNVIVMGMPVPDGDYTAKVSDVGKFPTKKNSLLLAFQGTLTSGDEVHTFEGKKFIVITDSLIWEAMEPGKEYQVTTKNRRIESMDEV